jgi:hypothetical protein
VSLPGLPLCCQAAVAQLGGAEFQAAGLPAGLGEEAEFQVVGKDLGQGMCLPRLVLGADWVEEGFVGLQ